MAKQFSFSQLVLAIAITFLASAIFNISRYIPDVLTTINHTTKTADALKPEINQIIEEVALVREEVALVRQQIELQVPAVLTQVEQALPVVDRLIGESEHYSSQLPTLFTKISLFEARMMSLEKKLPEMFLRIDDITNTSNAALTEIALWRPHSRAYLAEIKQSREDIPFYLTRAENIVMEAKTIGSDASKGIVSGFFKGVVSLPFEVVSGLTGIVDSSSRSAKHLTAKDVSLMQEKVIQLLNDSKQEKSIWYNVDSGNRGVIQKGKTQRKNNQLCYTLIFNNHFSNEKERLTEVMCLDENGLWNVM